MKQYARFGRLGLVLMLLFSFIGTLSYVVFAQAKNTLTLEEARAKKDYWGRMGFPQYDPKTEGYEVTLSSEQKRERLELLAQYADQKGITPAQIKSRQTGGDWNRCFEDSETLKREARRLNLSISQYIEYLNGLAKVSSGQSGFSFDYNEPVSRSCEPSSPTKEDKIMVLMLFCPLDVWREIAHVPILRLCGLASFSFNKYAN